MVVHDITTTTWASVRPFLWCLGAGVPGVREIPWPRARSSPFPLREIGKYWGTSAAGEPQSPAHRQRPPKPEQRTHTSLKLRPLVRSPLRGGPGCGDKPVGYGKPSGACDWLADVWVSGGVALPAGGVGLCGAGRRGGRAGGALCSPLRRDGAVPELTNHSNFFINYRSCWVDFTDRLMNSTLRKSTLT